MKPRTWLILLVVLLILLKLTFFSVDETQVVIVTEFGRPVRTIEAAGLKAKCPWQTRITLDKRLQLYDPPGSEFLTEPPEKKNLIADTYVCWRIAPGQAVKFLQTCGDRAAAEMRLHDIVWAELSAAVGHAQFAALVSTDPQELKAREIMSGVLERCQRRALADYGIEVVDVAIKRLNFPEENKQAVFDRMRAERQRIAKQYRAEGEREAITIRAKADKERTRLLAEAYRDGEKIRGEADAKATAIYAAAHGRDPRFYEFTRTLDAYKKFLGKETTVVLSSDSELLELLTEGQR